MIAAARPARTFAALCFGIALTAACSPVLERAPIDRQNFVFAPGRPEPVSDPRAGVLRIGVVRVTPPFQNRSFVLRTGEATYDSDFYNQFAAPPGILLRDVLVEWLRAGSTFAAVSRGSEAPPDWLLEIDLESLYGDARDPSAPKAVIAFAVRLLDAHAQPASIAFEKSYASSEPVASATPAALADAWNRALARMLGELDTDLDAAKAQAAARSAGTRRAR